MSYSTFSDICKNVARIGGPDSCPALREYCEKQEDEGIQVGVFAIAGWKLSSDSARIGKKERLFGDTLVKNDKLIYLINSSEYAMVCEYDFVVCSDDRDSV